MVFLQFIFHSGGYPGMRDFNTKERRKTGRDGREGGEWMV